MPKDIDLQKGNWRRLWSNFTRGKRINAVSREAEMYFWRLYAAVDDFGNLEAEPFLLHAATAGRRSMTPDEIVDWVNELASVTLNGVLSPLLSLYEVDGDDFLHIHNFVEWQPAGRNGKRVQRFPMSPWDAEESANDYIHLNGQRTLRSQGESRYIQNNPAPAKHESDTVAGRQDDRGNPDYNNNNNKINIQTARESNDSLVRKLKGLEKGQYVIEGFEYWKNKMGLSDSTQLTPKRQKVLGDRWKDTTMLELMLAIDGCEGDDFHMARGKYANDTPHNDILVIARDRAKVENLMQRASKKRKPEDKSKKQDDARRRWSSGK